MYRRQNYRQGYMYPLVSAIRTLLKPRLHQIHVAVYKYPGRATCIRVQVDTCRRNDNFVADTGYNRRRQAIQMDTSGYNLYQV